MNRKKLHEILDLVLDINETEASAFFDFAGHVDNLVVYVYEKGWKAYDDPDYRQVVYGDEEDEINKIINDLKNMKEGKAHEN